MSRPALELADIVRRHGARFRQNHPLTLEQLRPLRAIEICRTAELGGHVEQCSQCERTRIAYNSCRNRHCPKCQSLDRARWLEKRTAELLPVEYFHVVFSLPQALAGIALQNKKVVYGILFRAAAETLLTLARDPQHFGAEIGFFAILHTWGQNLLHHPHLHCVVPGGGISPDGEWVPCRPGFFLPVRVLSRLFRRLFLEMLARAFRQHQLRFHGDWEHLHHHDAFSSYTQPLEKIEWVVYAKPPFGGPRQVLDYLGRYTHRIAISNDRLVSQDDTSVSFRWKDYRHNNRRRLMKLAAHEFLRRLLLHTLPSGFQRIRHYGLFANRHRRQALQRCRCLLATPVSDLLPRPAVDFRDLYQTLTQVSLRHCPYCRTGLMQVIEVLPPRRFRPVRHEDTS
jgi:hypothetical protein